MRSGSGWWSRESSVELTPSEFELQVVAWLKEAGSHLEDFSAIHQGVVSGQGGEYAIDVLVRFSVAGACFVAIVECKHMRRAVEREDLLALESKLRDVGAHKGMVFSTSGFQRGAIEYASARGIATVTVIPGQWLYETKTAFPPVAPPPWVKLPRYAGCRLTAAENGFNSHTLHEGSVDALREWLDEKVSPLGAESA